MHYFNVYCYILAEDGLIRPKRRKNMETEEVSSKNQELTNLYHPYYAKYDLIFMNVHSISWNYKFSFKKIQL